jgi:apolipoprotein N-acyltransferase
LPRAPPAFPLLCYEVIFPEEAATRGERAGWLLNLTNDGWFGISSGPYQHLEQARLRAIEQGLPLVRAANTGISGCPSRQRRWACWEGLLELPCTVTVQ